MKRCPTCNQTFDDDALGYCLNDGAALVSETSSAPTPNLQATMMATPPSLGGSSYPPPSSGPGSGSFNPPPPNQSWTPPSTPTTSAPAKSGGINKKWIFAGIGCLGLSGIVVIIAIVMLVVFSGPASKMNPYKGELKALAPETMGIYKRVDVDELKERDKEGFGAVNDAIGVAYKDGIDTKIEMFIGNYATPKDAEAGLESFKNKLIGKGFTTADSGSKKIGWRTVGTRFILNKDDSLGKVIDDSLPDGGRMVQVQSATPTPKSKKIRMVGWTNGSVIHVVAGDENKAVYFEQTYDAAMK